MLKQVLNLFDKKIQSIDNKGDKNSDRFVT